MYVIFLFNEMKGMSSAEELIEVWNKFKSEDEPELVVNWEFQDIENLGDSNKVYIQNLRSLYNSDVPGHWVACVRTGVIYFYYDPFGCILVKRGVKLFKDAGYIYESLNQDQNFTGENSDSCGYFCIFYLLNFVRKFRRAGYNYAVFETSKGRFIDTIPAEKYIKINFEKMEEEITNNMSVETKSNKSTPKETLEDDETVEN